MNHADPLFSPLLKK